MQITFLGADHEVTGSCHYMRVCGRNILVDCGMEQGNDVYENQELPINASDVDYVLLTHAHIDHSGLIPLLYVNGFRGKVYTTRATADLCKIMLRDSAHIQMFEAEWRNRKAKRSGGKEFVPLYDLEAAENVMKHFVPCDYEQIIEIEEGLSVRFQDAGHLLGSASIEVWFEEDGIARKIVFSGDIGNYNKPIIKDPHYVSEADFVVMESTYGNRCHNDTADSVQELARLIEMTLKRGGNLVIPSFAVGRTQELLYYIRKIKADNMIPDLPDFKVYVDSPLAVEATSIFNKHVEGYFDEEAMDLVRQGINPISFPGLVLAVSGAESKNINFIPEPKVIISASGMCEAGRIRHHLKHNLWRAESMVLFVGYQANGTMGRAILEGAKSVRLFGEEVEIRAEIRKMEGTSGHADKNGLLHWINEFEPKPKMVFVVHGEDSVCDDFVDCLNKEYGFNAEAPYTGSSYSLVDGRMIESGNREKKSRRVVSKRNNSIYDRLVAAGKRLLAVIAHNEGGANKDLAKFTDQINALCDKWDR
ncbi:MAG: MBL fold metallo-hydrolase [Alistipes sp.]|nr:MBL fold metallo-hydrolase [Alistipes sp.]